MPSFQPSFSPPTVLLTIGIGTAITNTLSNRTDTEHTFIISGEQDEWKLLRSETTTHLRKILKIFRRNIRISYIVAIAHRGPSITHSLLWRSDLQGYPLFGSHMYIMICIQTLVIIVSRSKAAHWHFNSLRRSKQF